MDMPVLFIGHGSPMNALENNPFTQTWCDVAKSFPQPAAILAISAHWYTNETRITSGRRQKTIHDFYGFPPQLFACDYPAAGHPQLAQQIVADLAGYCPIIADDSWGLDHGIWSILCHLYPQANIPVIQLSLNSKQSPQWHLELGRQLQFLRSQRILIMASGNIVHNLASLNWQMSATGFAWAHDFDHEIVGLISTNRQQELCNYQKLSNANLAVPHEDHFLPLLYAIGAGGVNPQAVKFFNQQLIYGSLSMTSFCIY